MGCDGSKGHHAAQKQSGKDKNKAKHRAVPVRAIKAYGGCTYTSIFNSILDGVVKVNVKLSHYRPGVAQRVPGS
jgi:hypothetical protein